MEKVLLKKIPHSALKKPTVLPVKTSNGKCAPTPTRVSAMHKPAHTSPATQTTRCGIFWGRNAKSKTVSVVKTVIEWPEGKLLWPCSFSPIITKLLGSKIAAGRGTENTVFKPFENTNDRSDADMRASQMTGA